MKRVAAALTLMTFAVLGIAAAASLASLSRHAAGVTCNGQIVKIFDGFGTGAAVNGATEPTFSTRGQAYCLTAIQSYHWNGGKGQAPGTLGLKHVSGPAGFSTVGPFQAVGSAGQNNAPNVNWQANVPTSPDPTVIDGTYDCTDSDPATWSASTAGGPGFCNVYGILAQGVAAPPAAPKVKASAKEVVEPGGRIELIVKDLGTTPITMVRFRAHNWFIEKLGAVQQKGICTIDGTDQMVCDKNFRIDPGKSIPFTITQFEGANDGGYVWIGGSQLHIVVDGPQGSPPSTPPPVTPRSRVEKAIELVESAIEDEQTAIKENYSGDREKAPEFILKSDYALYTARSYELDFVNGTGDARELIDEARNEDVQILNFQRAGGRGALLDQPLIEKAVHKKIAALAELRQFLAKKR